MTSFLRIIKFAFQDLGRNIGLSIMTVLILVLMLLSIDMLWGVDVLTGEAVSLVKSQVNISLHLKPDADNADVEEIKKYLNAFPEVVELDTVSREEVLKSFQEKHSMDVDVLGALEELEGNPFGATVMFKTHEPEDYGKIMAALDVPEYENLIESKSYEEHQEGIEKIQNITNRIEKVGFWLTALFAIISFLIIFNTIRVAIYTHRMEISIKRLVGASNWFIRGPYLVESFIFTIISVLITTGCIYLSLHWLDPYITIAFPSGFSLTNYYNSHILVLIGVQFLSVLALTMISSILAMRRQLKV
jgi:cell division transport system permease protein